MVDSRKTKEQLIKEIHELRQRISESETTKQKLIRTEKALYESETEYRTLFESMKEGIIVTGPAGQILSANPAAATLLGYDNASELIGKPMVQFYENSESRRQLFKELFAKGYVDEFETIFVKKDGTRAHGLASITLHRDEQGNILRVDGMFRDITERKQAEEDRERLRVQLFHAQKMEALGSLAGGIAHDFNNLLTTIQGHVGLALTKDSDSDEIKDNLQQIKLTADIMSALTRQLLLFSRKQKLELQVFNINDLVEKMVKMLDPIIDKKIIVHTDLAPNIWSVNADFTNIEQVVMNLVLNARDAMANGGDLVISTGNIVFNEDEAENTPGSYPGEFVRLTIKDSGKGMAQQTLQRIFEPFFTTKKLERGTGLGMSIVYGIVKQHNGWIDVSSLPGK